MAATSEQGYDSHRFQKWLPYAALGFIALLAAYLNRGFSTEDAFITYRYSYNLATGHGFVYNLGERYLGTSAPLYGLLLGILGMLNANWIPAFSMCLCAIGLFGSALGIYAFGEQVNRRAQGAVAAILFVLSPLTLESFGSEFPLLMLFVIWALVLYKREKMLHTASFGAVAFLIRPDSALLLLVIAFDYLFSQRKFPWKELLVITTIIAPFLILAKLYYGSFFPGTMAAKVAQTQSGNWHLFLRDAYGALRNRYFPPSPGGGYSAALKIPIALLLAGVALFRVARPWRLILIWTALFVLFYQFARLPYYHWYLVPISIGLSILVAGLLDAIVSLALWRATSSKARQLAFGAVLITGCSLRLMALSKGPPSFDPKMKLYQEIGQYMNSHTAPNESIGYVEIGLIGYYSHRRIIDPLGLVTADVAPHVANRDFSWALEQYEPDYILRTEGFDKFLFPDIDRATWFNAHYTKSIKFTANGAQEVTVYDRLPK